eukprot:3856875-Rhodomonas_salina.1
MVRAEKTWRDGSGLTELTAWLSPRAHGLCRQVLAVVLSVVGNYRNIRKYANGPLPAYALATRCPVLTYRASCGSFGKLPGNGGNLAMGIASTPLWP